MAPEPPEAEQFRDFSHRDYRPDHPTEPHVKGIGYGEDILMTPQKAAGLVCKIARGAVKGRIIKTLTKSVSHGKK